MEIKGLNSEKIWDYENGFYWFSPVNRISKLITHWEIYQKTLNVPGEIFELGVLKGASFIRWASFREMLESSSSRKIVGFDAFGKFPIHESADTEDKSFISKHDGHTGDGVDIEELEEILTTKGFSNTELYKGDVFKTLPEYLISNPQTKISLLHLDMDTYHPTLFALDQLWDRLSSGGALVLDDYNAIAGATNAVDEFLEKRDIKVNLKKGSYYKIPAYVIKT